MDIKIVGENVEKFAQSTTFLVGTITKTITETLNVKVAFADEQLDNLATDEGQIASDIVGL